MAAPTNMTIGAEDFDAVDLAPGTGILAVAGSTTGITVVGGSSWDEAAGVEAAIRPLSGAVSAPDAGMRPVPAGMGIGCVSPWPTDRRDAPHDPQLAAESLTFEPH